ncbi:hypothetical protein [Robbsia andropogonis]|uniref:hypothetical protein n=1 Tax=Robbsia andropogonis TaxID=28092 RepID=UPI0004B7C8FD|nr:hypothetical protein [Robbsia andropogonis]MCP1117141.1 hypothetical protein [Robbsia andropogonis]MCP1128487.1 hypothetical protein [Robbsia andropogonis]
MSVTSEIPQFRQGSAPQAPGAPTRAKTLTPPRAPARRHAQTRLRGTVYSLHDAGRRDTKGKAATRTAAPRVGMISPYIGMLRHLAVHGRVTICRVLTLWEAWGAIAFFFSGGYQPGAQAPGKAICKLACQPVASVAIRARAPLI